MLDVLTEDKPNQIHHCIPKARGPEGYNTEHEFNLKRVRKTFHQRIHALWAEQTPQEQLHTWLDVNLRTLSDRVREKVTELVCMLKSEFYIPELIR